MGRWQFGLGSWALGLQHHAPPPRAAHAQTHNDCPSRCFRRRTGGRILPPRSLTASRGRSAPRATGEIVQTQIPRSTWIVLRMRTARMHRIPASGDGDRRGQGEDAPHCPLPRDLRGQISPCRALRLASRRVRPAPARVNEATPPCAPDPRPPPNSDDRGIRICLHRLHAAGKQSALPSKKADRSRKHSCKPPVNADGGGGGPAASRGRWPRRRSRSGGRRPR